MVELEKINRALELKNYCNIAVLLAEEEQNLIDEFCNILVELGGYKFIWIGFVESDKLEISAKAGAKSETDNKRISMDEHLETEMAEGNEVFDSLYYRRRSCNDSIDVPAYLIPYGIRSSLFLPIMGSDEIKGICAIYSEDENAFDQDEIQTIGDMLMYLVFGIGSIRTKKNKEKAEKELLTEKEELSVTLKSLIEGVITTNLGGQIILMNKAVEEILEVESFDLYGLYIFSVLPFNMEDVSNADTGFYFNDYKKFKALEIKQLTITTRSNKKKVISVKSSEIRDTNGKIKGFIYVISDDTEKTKIETQLSLSQKMESIGLLAAGIAHEINTPMQYIGDNALFLQDSLKSIFGYIDFLETEIKKRCSSDGLKIFKIIKKMKEESDFEFLKQEIPLAIEQTQTGIKHVSKIVLAMKDFSHPSQGEFQMADINNSIDVTITISHNAWKYVADLETELDPNLPLVYCLTDEIKQVLLNLIVNSAQAIETKQGKNATEKGLIRICSSLEDGYCVIKISDTGCGISKENIKKIFDPFFTTKEVGKGTGQGLAIAHDLIVNKHNGEIYVESVPDKGTIMTLKIPVNKEQVSENLPGQL